MSACWVPAITSSSAAWTRSTPVSTSRTRPAAARAARPASLQAGRPERVAQGLIQLEERVVGLHGVDGGPLAATRLLACWQRHPAAPPVAVAGVEVLMIAIWAPVLTVHDAYRYAT